MKFLAIKQLKSGKNIEFLNEEFKIIDLQTAINHVKKGSNKAIKVITTKHKQQYLKSVNNQSREDNLDNIAITCNLTDYLYFDRKHLYLRGGNHKPKKKWPAFSGKPKSKLSDQNKKNFGPLPEGKYTVHFDKKLEYKNNTGLIDVVLWQLRSGSWGYIVTPLMQIDGQSFGRDGFYIHGGKYIGTAGCIELNGDSNKNFHAYMSLYARNFKLVVKY